MTSVFVSKHVYLSIALKSLISISLSIYLFIYLSRLGPPRSRLMWCGSWCLVWIWATHPCLHCGHICCLCDDAIVLVTHPVASWFKNNVWPKHRELSWPRDATFPVRWLQWLGVLTIHQSIYHLGGEYVTISFVLGDAYKMICHYLVIDRGYYWWCDHFLGAGCFHAAVYVEVAGWH